jgi:hypothetical protein
MTDPQRRARDRSLRAVAKSYLTTMGMLPDDVELWLGAWEASSGTSADRDAVAFWDQGGRWAMDAWMAGQQPPTIEG